MSVFRHIPGPHSFSKHISLVVELVEPSPNSLQLFPEVPGIETFLSLTDVDEDMISECVEVAVWVCAVLVCHLYRHMNVRVWKGATGISSHRDNLVKSWYSLNLLL